jgi:hypothetical protein
LPLRFSLKEKSSPCPLRKLKCQRKGGQALIEGKRDLFFMPKAFGAWFSFSKVPNFGKGRVNL